MNEQPVTDNTELISHQVEQYQPSKKTRIYLLLATFSTTLLIMILAGNATGISYINILLSFPLFPYGLFGFLFLSLVGMFVQLVHLIISAFLPSYSNLMDQITPWFSFLSLTLSFPVSIVGWFVYIGLTISIISAKAKRSFIIRYATLFIFLAMNIGGCSLLLKATGGKGF